MVLLETAVSGFSSIYLYFVLAAPRDERSKTNSIKLELHKLLIAYCETINKSKKVSDDRSKIALPPQKWMF